MYQDGPKRQGRFIKKGSRVAEHIVLQDFAFKEVHETPVISHDNTVRTIVHHKYHAAAELGRTVLDHDSFNEDLQNPAQRRSVIFPLDFTKDWERDKKLRKDRSSRVDEEMEFDFESSLGSHADDEEEEAKTAASAPPVQATEAAPLPKADVVNNAQKPEAKAAAARVEKEENPHFASIDAVGAALKNLMNQQQGAPESKSESGIALKKSEDSASFIAVTTSEAGAADEYRQRLAAQKISEADLKRATDEAKALGYRDGFRVGEEKAELAARQHASEMFGKVGEIINEFSNLKKEILSNVQENFLELSQAIAESLIEREFTIHPEAFVTVVARAVAETSAGDSFKIRVHPTMYDRIAALGAGQLTESLVKDPEIDAFDFRIDSNLSVVDVNVKKMIRDLLNQADIKLFDEETVEKAS